MVAVQRGLTPVSIGLLLAGCLTFARSAVHGRMTLLIAVTVFTLVLRSGINPTFLVLAGAIVGVLTLR
jgi:chromate transporter